MHRSAASFESELHISTKPVIVVLFVSGLAVFLAIDFLFGPLEKWKIPIFELGCCALSAIAWLLDSWRPQAGRWFTITALVTVVYVVTVWLDFPGFIILMVIPAAVAATLISMPAGVATAVVETSLVLLLSPKSAVTGADLSTGTILVAIWAVLGVMYSVYRPLRRLSNSLEEYLEHARHSLEEARDRRAELEQVVESLANANRQLALANERTAILRAIAEEAQKAKTAFVTNVSHEFRTPLNMIIGLVELMVNKPEIYAVVLPPKMREDLKVVYSNCEHLANMINDVLDLTRMEAGRLTLHRERTDLKEIIDSSVTAVRPLLEKKQLALRVAIPPDLPQVYCDCTRIEQVILNLVSNAARFTEKGEITVEVARQDQRIRINVADTGPGIPPEDFERIFEPFWQISGEHQYGDKGGSGLGLSISKQFVQLHGGQMWLESELGVGTSFSFTLPISSPIEHIARPGYLIREDWVWREHAFKASQAASTAGLFKPRVIICDEAGDLYSQLARYSDEVEFVGTRNLAQARQELQRCPAHAVVLNIAASDALRPLVEAIRQQVPDTPTIGCSVPRPSVRAIDAGALGYLVKPVTIADLERTIAAVGKPVRRILVVDDDAAVLDLFRRMLHVCDSTLEIVTASSGEEALAELRRMPPDLMLLDVVMPGMDGWQILEAMDHDPVMKGIATFFVSAQDPADQWPVSEFCLVTINGGISLSKLLRCSLGISALLLEPEGGLDLAPG